MLIDPQLSVRWEEVSEPHPGELRLCGRSLTVAVPKGACVTTVLLVGRAVA